MTKRVLYWLRQDLRLKDNPALCEAVKAGSVCPIYIFDDACAKEWSLGGARRWWLFESLKAFNADINGKLAIFQGDPLTIILRLVKQHGLGSVFWNRCYQPWQVARDTELKAKLKKQGIPIHSFNASLLWEPFQVLKADKTPYRVFTPFFKKGCLGASPPRDPLKAPGGLVLEKLAGGVPVDQLPLLPKGFSNKATPQSKAGWPTKLGGHWTPSEKAAHTALRKFIDKGLAGYKDGRDRPALFHTSMLSPFLHQGQLSPNQVWYASLMAQERGLVQSKDAAHFQSELGWREFSYNLLHHNPDLPTKPLNKAFAKFPWEKNTAHLGAWQQGRTGYPLVDAGMRQLWETGFMHNRLRMITASFLIKHLRIDWRLGEKWFWDCLVDADLASNSASWQWVAGCGADAAPYFRIFNPILQGQRFDPEGAYTRRWVPELKNMPDSFLFRPWLAPQETLKKAGVILGETYPHPVVLHDTARAQALQAFQSLKNPAP